MQHAHTYSRWFDKQKVYLVRSLYIDLQHAAVYVHTVYVCVRVYVCVCYTDGKNNELLRYYTYSLGPGCLEPQ